jgi:flagellar biosynthesis chaperone FliJ
MKKIAIIFAAAVALTSCNQGELERSNNQKDSLMQVLNQRENDLRERENSMNEFITSFNEVEKNLDSVSARQQIIYMNSDRGRGEVKASQKDKINMQIKAINDLMESNRQTIAELKQKLKSSGKKNAKLEQLVATLQEQIRQKDSELAALNQRLDELNVQVAQLTTEIDTLKSQNTARARTISDNIATMHTAYYIIGKAKELEKQKLIDRKGGLLGIGRTSKPTGNFDNSMFTKIDYTQISSIPVNSSGVKIVTSHPSGSYKMETDEKNKKLVKSLIITDPERFWSTSKYLVIEGNPQPVDKSISKADAKDKSY